MKQPKPFVKSLRVTRPYHRYIGVILSLFIVLSSVTGILLSWKKQVHWLQPTEQIKQTISDSDWLSISDLKQIADKALSDQVEIPVFLERMDVRITKGFVKMRYQPENWEVQINGKTGDILSIAQRNADWIEQLHDGSIISENYKLISLSLLGLGLLFLSLSGLWLWIGPSLVKKRCKEKRFKV